MSNQKETPPEFHFKSENYAFNDAEKKERISEIEELLSECEVMYLAIGKDGVARNLTTGERMRVENKLYD